jgi:excisionase family DNA binding protein
VALTLSVAADRLGVSTATLRHQIRNGSLEATKVGRDWTVEESEVRRYAAISRGKPGRPVGGQRRATRQTPANQMSFDLVGDE